MSQPPQYPPQYPPPPPGGPQNPYGQPYPSGGPYGRPPKPDSHLVWSILTTLFCCLPFGIVSIVQAAKVDGLWTAGDYAGSLAASESAKKWAIISAAVGVGLVVIYVIVAIGIASSSSGPGY
jgi:interferon-induced transmembrane protein